MAWLDEWLQRRPDADREWREASESSDYWFELTPSELNELLTELEQTCAGGSTGRRRRTAPAVRLLLSAFPA